MPEQHRNHMARRLHHPFSTAKWSTTHTGYRVKDQAEIA
jgi:formylmethanofuran dehydrogenase subunit A